MTECQQINRLLPRMPDGDLQPPEARLVETHLAACATCQREAAGFSQLRELIAAATPPPPRLPSGVQVAAWILEQEPGRWRIGRVPARPAVPRPHWGPGVALAVLVAAALLSVRSPYPPAGQPIATK